MTDQAARLREMVRVRPPAAVARASATTDAAMSAPLSRRGIKAIAVTSGKGGVGKTNIALMLSIALASLRKKVLLFDADLGLANVHILLGVAPRRNLSHVANGECSIADTICTGPSGVAIVPGASGVEAMANLDAARLSVLRGQLAALESEYDFVVVDTGAGIGAGAVEFAAHADLCLCVMTPEPTSLADAYAMVKVLFDKGCENVQVLVNMATSDEDGARTFETLSSLVVKFLKRQVKLAGVLPSDQEIPRLVRQQKLMLLEHPQSSFSTRLTAVARRLCGMPASRRGGFFARVFGKEQ